MTVTAPIAIYRFFNVEGQLLYVGITGDLATRWKHHAERKPWWSEVATYSVDLVDTRREAERIERVAVQTEKPLHNVIHTSTTGRRQPATGSICTDPALASHIGIAEAAQILDLSHQYVYRLAERGDLVGQKVGSTWVFRIAVVERLAKQRG